MDHLPKRSKPRSLDLLAIGDSTEDIFLKIEDSKVLCDLDENYCWLCLDYREETEVLDVKRTTAGNAANVAIGAARMGYKSALYTIVGCDETGKKILKVLEEEKVSTGYVAHAANCTSNGTVVLNYKAERTQLIFHQGRDYKFPKVNKVDWIYLTAMGEGCEKIYKDLEKYLFKNKVKLGFNPGSHQLDVGLESYGRLLELCTVLFLNKEETREVFNVDPKHKFAHDLDEMKYLLSLVRDHGPEIAVITDGKKGAYAYDGKIYYYIPVFDTVVVEMTGAGDSFSIGFVGALMSGKGIDEALLWGSFNATSVIQYIGPQEGLLTKRQINKFIKDNPKYKVMEIE